MISDDESSNLKTIIAGVPNLTDASSETDSNCCSNSSSSNTTLQHSLQDEDGEHEVEIDPYEDVRDRMEELTRKDKGIQHEFEAIPFFVVMTVYLGYATLIVCGHVRDTMAKIFRNGRYMPHKQTDQTASASASKYALLLKSWENFYTRRLYHRIQDCFNRPIATNAGATIGVIERVSNDGNKTMQVLSGLEGYPNRSMYETHRHVAMDKCVARVCANLGSYNYLGFADDWRATCQDEVLGAMEDLPVSMSSSRAHAGRSKLHDELEDIVSQFVGKEATMVFNMGFNTNCCVIPALAGPGDLIISDELNHTSIVNGVRASGAAIRVFKHNDAQHLNQVLREAIVIGRPRVRRPFNKIIVAVEGVYSMEGHYCNLKDIVRVCKANKAYLYLDEAHSIGAMGPNGKGCCDYAGVSPSDVDILMGTFSKSFGGMGGYIASSTPFIYHLKNTCAATLNHTSLSPIVCQQVITAFKIIMGLDNTKIGRAKLTALKDNSNYFRMKLIDMGLHVLGNYDSPVVPVMLYNPTKIAAFSRECLKRGIAVVVVGFPAVPILMSRARFCISAAHTREELDKALMGINEVADILKLRYAISHIG